MSVYNARRALIDQNANRALLDYNAPPPPPGIMTSRLLHVQKIDCASVYLSISIIISA